MLFSDIERTATRSPLHAEPNYDYLDASGRPEAAAIRATLEDWFTRYPAAHRADLLGRFQSPDNVPHNAAAFELYLHELFLRLGCHVTVHPETPTTKDTHPDFMVTAADGSRIYVEAALSDEESAQEKGARARLNVVYDAINKLEARGWFLGVSTDGYPQTPPSGRKLRGQLARWLAGLDPDQVIADAEQTGDRAYSTFEYTESDWRLEFTAFPRAPEKRDRPVQGVIGAYSSGVRWSNSREAVRDTLLSKGSHYGELDAPLVVAVNAHVGSLDNISIMEALFGQETFVMSRANPQAPMEMRRAANGFWHGPNGPQYTRVSAVLIGQDLQPWSFAARAFTLYENPWATRRLFGPVRSLRRFEPQPSGEMHEVPGAHPREIFTFPPGYPGA